MSVAENLPTRPLRRDHSEAKPRWPRLPAWETSRIFRQAPNRSWRRIRAHVPQFDFGKDAKNQTLRIDDWKDELQRLEDMLPKDLLVRMVTLNASDFALYHRFRP